MDNSDIIVYELDQSRLQAILDSSINYALISLPFTIDRMGLSNIHRQINNIIKGKFAEKYFEEYCKDHSLNVDFASCSTPFWQVDNRDFIYKNKEWDLKNNYFYADSTFNGYEHLPALVPNRHDHDQWEKRKTLIHPKCNESGFLFSFIRMADLKGSDRGEDFYEFQISRYHQIFLMDLVERYNGQPQSKQPFNEKDFWDEIKKEEFNKLKINFIPEFIITGVSLSSEFSLFKDTGPRENLNYQNYDGGWYKKLGRKNSLCFLDGKLWTVIKNATVPVSYLPSFKKYT